MSMELMDEHEQGEQVRAWLRNNGASVLGGVAIGVAAIIGWQGWNGAKLTHRVEAAQQYASLVDAVERNDRDGAEAFVKSLRGDYKDTAYALMGDFTLADLQAKAGESQAAADTLRDAVANAETPAMKSLARTRLARALIGAGQGQAAIDALGSEENGAIASELRGDAWLALGKRDEAIAAYRKAYATYDETLPGRRLVEMKLLDLGVEAGTADA